MDTKNSFIVVGVIAVGLIIFLMMRNGSVDTSDQVTPAPVHTTQPAPQTGVQEEASTTVPVVAPPITTPSFPVTGSDPRK